VSAVLDGQRPTYLAKGGYLGPHRDRGAGMEISNQEKGGATVVALVGNFDTNTAALAQAHFDELIAKSPARVIADFSRVDYISSAGLRVLLATGKKLRRSGGELRICSLNEMAAEVFEISGFATLFQIFADADAAIAG
jgi:anti-anti-sigma factor